MLLVLYTGKALMEALMVLLLLLPLPVPAQGYNARPANVELVLLAFRDGLRQQGFLKN